MKFSPTARLALMASVSFPVHGWTPTVGDSWNYNLETPVQIDVGVDVVFMDMGKGARIGMLHEIRS